MTARTRPWRTLGLVAGGGGLPLAIAQACTAAGKGLFVARIAGAADPELARFPGAEFGLGAVGARFAALKAAGCDAVVFAGLLARPDFGALKLDGRGMMLMPKVIAAARKGDDALLRVLMEAFEAEGFYMIGAEEALGDLLAPAGPLGAHAPDAAALEDIAKAAAVADALGAWDVGQGAVVCAGLVLALEAQEGTDAMLARVAALPEAIRGTAQARRGVLLKRAKPIQERRVDLPTIGVRTIEGAAGAGLAGVAIEARSALIVDRAETVARADALGLFVYGFDPRQNQ